MATLADINAKITNLLGVDTNTYSNANRLIDINLWYQKIVGMILDSQDESDWDDSNNTSSYPRATFALTTNRDYAIGASYNFLKIKDLSVTYDSTNFYRATPIDYTQFNIGDAPASATTANTQIDANFSKTVPRYDYKFGAIFLYPRANSDDVAAGASAIVEFFRGPTEFSSGDLSTGTASPGIDSTFHMMLAYGPAYEYAQAKQMPMAGSIRRELQVYEEMLRKQYSSKQIDRRYALTAAYQDYK